MPNKFRRLSTTQIWALVARRLLALLFQLLFFAVSLAALSLLALA